MRSLVDLAGCVVTHSFKFSLLELFVLLWLYVIIGLFIAINLHKLLNHHFWRGFSPLDLQQLLVVVTIVFLDPQQILVKIKLHSLQLLLTVLILFGILRDNFNGLVRALHIDFIFNNYILCL